MSGKSIGRLYGPLDAPKTMKVLLIAYINNIELETTPGFDIGTDTKTNEYLAKFPLGQSPGFEAKSGFCLYESAAISLHIAELNNDSNLYGKTSEDRSIIMQYIFNIETQIEKHCVTLLYQSLGKLESDTELTEIAYNNLDRNLEIYNNVLAKSNYLVANQLTLADIFFYFSILYPFKLVIDDERKTKFANVTKFVEEFGKAEGFPSELINAS
ncbi:glutathione S-transferase [Conidiobolus coronatus NRRL 28638]|uniref:Glutathione S-transferase n=1 Tax=Conidiobolus coronatus (strain ATCC 28846 / CBS 209.66 / NRRL 28638) TaxID=796925 RepID=A0A137P797_CONC2|nr:glutathione S-transferase [Conidiobolus coronatus NRRL 28638]|eukprot:KXN70839.1 glutathione S-transferase [Conidiobolus coronatus NRRL 28638]